MRSTGIVRKTDELGRVVLPIEIRRTLNIQEGDPVEIYVDNEMIILKKYAPGCSLCNSLDKLRQVQGIKLCQECINKIALLSRKEPL